MVKFSIIIFLNGLLFTLTACAELKSLFVIFRHGERGLIQHRGPELCKTDKYLKDIKTYWPDGIDQLTKIGKRNSNRVGKFIRTKYDDFLGNDLRDIFIRSLYRERCLESGMLFVNGMYQSQNLMAKNRNLPKPIPIHMIPPEQDSMFNMFSPCPNAESAMLEGRNDPGILSHFNEFQNLSRLLVEKCERPVNTFIDICFVYDIIRAELSTELKVADWVTPELIKEFERAHSYCFLSDTHLRKVQRLRTGIFFRQTFLEMEKIIKTDHLEPPLSDDDERIKKGYFYSGGDYFMAFFLSALKFENVKFYPPFGATIIMELYKHSNTSATNWDENSSIKFLYYNETNTDKIYEIKIPECRDTEFCTIKKIRDSLKDIILDQNQWEIECGLHDEIKMVEELKEKTKEMSTDLILVIIILVAVVINVIFSFVLNCKKRSSASADFKELSN